MGPSRGKRYVSYVANEHSHRMQPPLNKGKSDLPCSLCSHSIYLIQLVKQIVMRCFQTTGLSVYGIMLILTRKGEEVEIVHAEQKP